MFWRVQHLLLLLQNMCSHCAPMEKTALRIFPRSRDTWLTAIAFCDAKFKVWAKHAICGHGRASLTALTIFLALSVVTAMVLGFSSFHSVTVSCSFSTVAVSCCNRGDYMLRVLAYSTCSQRRIYITWIEVRTQNCIFFICYLLRCVRRVTACTEPWCPFRDSAGWIHITLLP